MNTVITSSAFLGLLILIIFVLPSYAGTFFTDSSDEIWSYFRFTCGLRCPYGFKTDVEGNPICECHDPCKYVYCLDGTKCVIHVTKCSWKSCKPKADCQDVGESKSRRRKINLYPPSIAMVQSDDASALSRRSDPGPNPMCLLPLTEQAKDCKNSRVRKRWFFDLETGKCMKFRGCRTGGNNFGRKKRCKRKCIRKRRSSRRRDRRTRSSRRRAKQ